MSVTLVAHALCTQAEALQWLQFSGTPTSDEGDVLNQTINAVTARIESEIGRQVVARQVTERHDGNGKYHLWLRQYPVTSVDEIKVYDLAGALYQTLDVSSTALTISDIGRITLRGQDPILEGEDNVVVKYKPGWTTCPDDVKLAALHWIADLWRKWTTRREPIQSVSSAGATTVYFNDAIPREVMAVLDRYRLTSAAG